MSNRERRQRRRELLERDREQNKAWRRMKRQEIAAARLEKAEKKRKAREERWYQEKDDPAFSFWLRVRIVLFMLLILCSLAICWIGAYYITHSLRWNMQPLVGQLVNSVLGFVIFGTIISIVSRFGRGKQREYWQMVIDALKRISKGDFKVSLPVHFGGGGDKGWGEVVQSINNMAADLDKMEHMRQEFISNVSHEIQSPLTSITGFARVLREEQLTPDQRNHYLNIIEQESVRLSRLSENMLKLASLDSEKHPFHAAPLRLDKQLQTLILACEPQWQGKNLEMSVDLKPVTIEADDDLLSQVWVNLLHNAIKFTPEGGSIHVTLETDGREAVVSVEDTGIGISAEDQAHIFERFFKADKSRTRSGGGSGLGLSIIQKIVQMHGGSVSVASTLGDGTRMTVRLPVAAARAGQKQAPAQDVPDRGAFS
uniref:sensor histidine kinase n=1 Tax=Paenibacillus sp. FSL W8-0194 TaxID=2921711 RepID=UPI00403EC1BB